MKCVKQCSINDQVLLISISCFYKNPGFICYNFQTKIFNLWSRNIIFVLHNFKDLSF